MLVYYFNLNLVINEQSKSTHALVINFLLIGFQRERPGMFTIYLRLSRYFTGLSNYRTQGLKMKKPVKTQLGNALGEQRCFSIGWGIVEKNPRSRAKN